MKRRHFMRGAKLFSGGYTIVEVMIFLAVSAGLIIIAYTFINNRLERTRFSQAVVDLEEQLRDIFNDTATGFYPSNQSFTCRPGMGVGGLTLPVLSGGSPEELGEKSNCIFFGKLIHFFSDRDVAGNIIEDANYDVYTMVALKDVDKRSLNFGRANESIVRLPIKTLGSDACPTERNVGIVEKKEMQYNMQAYKKMFDLVDNNIENQFFSLAVIPDFGAADTFGSSANSSSRVKLYAYHGGPESNCQGLTNGGQKVGFTEIKGKVIVCLKQDAYEGVGDANRVGYLEIHKDLTITRIIGSVHPKCNDAENPS